MSDSIIDLRDEKGVLVAKVAVAELDMITGDEFQKQLEAVAPRVSSSRVVLDFSVVEFIQSQGLRAVIVFRNAVKAAGGRVAVCGLRPAVRQVFALANLESIFEIHEDLAAAIGD